MKRWMGVFAALLLAALCGLSAWAAEDTYAFPAFDLEITAPGEDYYILLRDMDPDSPALADVGLTAEQVNELLRANKTYFHALYHDRSYELMVGVITGEECEKIFSYDILSEAQRKYLADEMTKEAEKQDTIQLVGDITWYEGEETPFLVGEFLRTGESGWSYQYQTVYNGRMITAFATSYGSSELTDEIREETRRLAEGIHFTQKLPVPQEVLKAFGKEDPWSWRKTLTVTAGLVGAAVFSSLFAANMRKFRGKYQEALGSVEKEKKQSAEDGFEENSEKTGGDDV